MPQWNSSSLDISQEETGPLNEPKTPMDWGAISMVLAPRARHGMEPREWIQAARERAYRERIEHLHFHGIQNGLHLYGAPKPGNPNREYQVTIDVPGKNITCSCRLFQSGLPCGHVGAAINLLSGIPEGTATRACTHQREIDLWSASLHLHG